MSRATTALALTIALTAVGIAGCGGDDDSDATPATTIDEVAESADATDSGDLEAWCLGYWTAITGVEDPSVIPALEAEIEASVPGDLRETWDAQMAIDEGPASSEWRRLDREINDYFLANCDPDVGTPITQP